MVPLLHPFRLIPFPLIPFPFDLSMLIWHINFAKAKAGLNWTNETKKSWKKKKMFDSNKNVIIFYRKREFHTMYFFPAIFFMFELLLLLFIFMFILFIWCSNMKYNLSLTYLSCIYSHNFFITFVSSYSFWFRLL